jgi:hypothetical protein
METSDRELRDGVSPTMRIYRKGGPARTGEAVKQVAWRLTATQLRCFSTFFEKFAATHLQFNVRGSTAVPKSKTLRLHAAL